jgi:hypothetical protein
MITQRIPNQGVRVQILLHFKKAIKMRKYGKAAELPYLDQVDLSIE